MSESSSSSVLRGEKAEKFRVGENLRAMGEVGIDKNRRTEALARQEWVTPGYIREVCAGLGRGQGVGLAILRMEQRTVVKKRQQEDDRPRDYLRGLREYGMLEEDGGEDGEDAAGD